MATPTMAPQWWVIPTMAPTKAPTASAPTTHAPFIHTAAPTDAAVVKMSHLRLGGYIALGAALVLLIVCAAAAMVCAIRTLILRRRRRVVVAGGSAAGSADGTAPGGRSSSSSSSNDSDDETSANTSDAEGQMMVELGSGCAVDPTTGVPWRKIPLRALHQRELLAWLQNHDLACFCQPFVSLGVDGRDVAELDAGDVDMLAEAAAGAVFSFQRRGLLEMIAVARVDGISVQELRDPAASAARHRLSSFLSDREEGSDDNRLSQVRYTRLEEKGGSAGGMMTRTTSRAKR